MEGIFGRLNMQKCVWRRNGTRCLEVDETWRYIQGLDMKIPQNQYAIILLRLLELDIGKCASIKKPNLFPGYLAIRKKITDM